MPGLNTQKNTMLSLSFYKNTNQSIMLRTGFSIKVSFYRVLVNKFLDIYKMSKKILNLLIMQAKQQFQHLLFLLLKEGDTLDLYKIEFMLSFYII